MSAENACTSGKGESIQCDFCGVWAHANCENISHDQFKAIKSFSSLHNFVYYCQANDCDSRIKTITIEWIQSRASPQTNAEAADITKQQLSF